MLPLLAVGLGLQALGGVAKGLNARKAEKAKDKEIRAGIEGQRNLDREATGLVNRTVTGIGQSTPEQSRANIASGYLQAIRNNQAQAGAPAPSIGGNRFRADLNAANAGVAQEGVRDANLLARIEAPARQRVAEDTLASQLGIDLADVKRRSDAGDYLTQLRASSIQPNPWVGMGADILGGVGSAVAAKGSAPKKGFSGPR